MSAVQPWKRLTSQKHEDLGVEVEFICLCTLGIKSGQDALLGFICPGMELSCVKIKAFTAEYRLAMAEEAPQV